MRVLFLLADNVYLTPYLQYYTNILRKMNIKYKIFFWDKNNNENINDKHYIRFTYNTERKIKKIYGYYKFRKSILKLIKKENFDIIVPLHPIVSFILANVLVNEYRKRYVYDIRDYSYEKYFWYRLTEKKLARNSMINIISSKGYKNFLPEEEYFVTHNIPNISQNELDKHKQLNNPRGKINISYIGLIRFMDQNKKVLNFFKNDERFHLNFIGTNAKQLQNYCDKNDIRNVTLIDTFDSKDTLNYYDNTDVIMNLYGNHTPLLDYALSNKLYYSACLYKPILVCEDTYMELVSKKYEIGYSLPMKSTKEKEKLYEWLINMNRKKFIVQCDVFMKDVYKEEEKLNKEIQKRILCMKKKGDKYD